jgi:xanthine dehydrogenase accessory factor
MSSRRKRELFDLAASLSHAGTSFVIATVVRRDGFTSAHQGDMAIIDEHGGFHGWVGGGCTRPTVEREAALALTGKKPRLIMLSPEPEREPRPGMLSLPMTCHSGGTVEIYLDPIIASPRLALFGRSPIIAALAALAHEIGYLVDVADADAVADELPGADRVFTSLTAPELDDATFVVVGTMGDLDEEAVMRALAIEPKYLGVIASRRRYALLRDALIARGVDVGALASIENPAGLDLGAREAGEVAVSILAQIVARRNAMTTAAPETVPVVKPVTAVDPVCKMTVTIASAKHVADWNGSSWYFCCGGCKTKFVAEPTKFVTITERDAG